MDLAELTKEEQEALLRWLYDHCSRYLGIWNVEKTAQEDILQTAVTQAWQNFNTLKDPQKLTAWARKILRNEVNQYYRKLQRERTHRVWFIGPAEQAAQWPEKDGETAYFEEGDAQLHEPQLCELTDLPQERFEESDLYVLVKSLGHPASTILLLNAVYDETLADIAETLCMNPSTVRSIAVRSARRLRKMILDDAELADRYRVHIEGGRKK